MLYSVRHDSNMVLFNELIGTSNMKMIAMVFRLAILDCQELSEIHLFRVVCEEHFPGWLQSYCMEVVIEFLKKLVLYSQSF